MAGHPDPTESRDSQVGVTVLVAGNLQVHHDHGPVAAASQAANLQASTQAANLQASVILGSATVTGVPI